MSKHDPNNFLSVTRAFLTIIVAMFMCGCRPLTPEQIALNRGLFDAAKSGDATAVRAAIAGGAQVNSRHESDWNYRWFACRPVFGAWTPLHRAAYFNQREVVKLLLDAGTDVDARDGLKRTPLHWAAEEGYAEIVRLLIDKGAEVNPPATTESPLRTSLDAGHDDVVLLLRERGGRLNTSEQKRINQDLYGASIAGDAARLEALLYQGAAIDSAPIHLVANLGNAKALRVLLDAGAGVDVVGKLGETPLHDAAGGGAREAVEMLVSRGADLNAKDKEGYVPILWAMYNGKNNIVRLLLEKGADANALDKKSLSLLQHAIGSNHSDAPELLRQHGAQKKGIGP